jgi:phage baseplate assembly protein W
MPIKDPTRKPFIEDNDSNITVGLDLPIRKSNGNSGFFASTQTILSSVKNNIRNLLNTNQGERLMQPLLGLNLKQYLFEQITEDTELSIQQSLENSFKYWLPFVIINDLQVKTIKDDSGIGPNQITIDIIFSIERDPNTLASVQVNVGDIENTNITTTELTDGVALEDAPPT